MVCSNLSCHSPLHSIQGLTWHASAVKGASSTIRSILRQPEGLWHCKKLQRLQWKHKCSSVLATVGVEAKQHFVWGICIKFARFPSGWAVLYVFCFLQTFFIRLSTQTMKPRVFWILKESSFDFSSPSHKTAAHTLYLHDSFTIDQTAYFF